jgi:hypothetical protein
MKKYIVVLAMAGLVTTGCAYDYDHRYPAEHRDHRSEERQPVRPPLWGSQPDNRRDSGEQRRDNRRDSGEQRRDNRRDSGEQRREEND